MTRQNVVRISLALWIALIGAVTVRVAVSKPTSQSVVPIYRAAGERWNAGESLYDPAPPLDVFRYPPGFAALFAPLSNLPEIPAAIAWRLSCATIFLIGLWRFARVVNRDAFPLIAALSAPLVLGSFNNGQVNIAIIGFVMLGVADAAGTKWTRSAIWLALAAGLKLYPLAAGLLVVLLFPRSLSWRLAIATGAVFAIPFALNDPSYVWQQQCELVEWMKRDDRLHTWALERAPRDWTVLSRTWLGWVPSTVSVRLTAALSGIAFAGLVWFSKRRNGVERTLPIVVVLSGIWMTLFGPATESVTYCLIAPGAAWLVATNRGWIRGLATTGYLLHFSAVICHAFPQSWRYTVLGPQAAGSIVLLIATVWRVMAKEMKPNQERELWAIVEGRIATTIRAAKIFDSSSIATRTSD